METLKYNPDPEVNPINQLYLDKQTEIERRIAELQRKKDDGVQMEYVELLEYNELTRVYDFKWINSSNEPQKKNKQLKDDIKNKNNEAVIEYIEENCEITPEIPSASVISAQKSTWSIWDILYELKKYDNIDLIKYIYKNYHYEFNLFFTQLDFNYIELIDKLETIYFLSEKLPEYVFFKLDFNFTETCKHPNPDLIKFLVAFPQRYSYLLDVDCQSVKSYNINGVIYNI
jgi:hypothetical protein